MIFFDRHISQLLLNAVNFKCVDLKLCHGKLDKVSHEIKNLLEQVMILKWLTGEFQQIQASLTNSSTLPLVG